MCDTLVAVNNATDDGSIIFGKNSDRPPNEAQVIRYFPRIRHAEGSTARCTHMEIPQAPETYEVLLSCPHWIWGAEMGANEWGVAIGNEAVWSKEAYADTGLLGMDLLRLGLERGRTAASALDIITCLLARHGQGGNCFHNQAMKYHNSFIIADPCEAWVLETADRYWVAQRVKDVRSISNGYTIGAEWDLSSPDLVEHAIEKGWCESRADFDFGRCYGDATMDPVVQCRERAQRSEQLLKAHKGGINIRGMMDFLRDHGGRESNKWSPDNRQIQSICMHAGPDVLSHSTASYVGRLTEQQSVHWMTGGSTPCLSVYMPFFLGGEIPDIFSRGGEKYDDDAFWWVHEKLVRGIQMDYTGFSGRLVSELKAEQENLLVEAQKMDERGTSFSPEEMMRAREAFMKHSAEVVTKNNRQWLASLGEASADSGTDISYRHFLNDLNKAVDIDF